MFVRNCWYVAGWTNEFDSKELTVRTMLNERLVFYRKGDGDFVALEDRCVHRSAPLSMGRREGDHLRCMYHGLKFAPSGRCLEIPGQDLVPERAAVRSYPVINRHGWLWVWMGDAALADPKLIPAAIGPDDAEWVLRTGQLDYEANYQLINDNIADFVHLSYVHAQSFGADMGWAMTRPKVTALDRGVRVERWVEGSPPIPPIGEAAKHRKVDYWAAYDLLVPGIVLFYSALYPVGTAAALNGEKPTGPSLHSNFTSQAVTPVTDKTSRYVFSWGPRRSQGDEKDAEAMLELVYGAFKEDRAMIEAQQKVMDLTPGAQPMLTNSDKAAVIFQRLMQSLARSDAESAGRATQVAR